MFCAIKGKGEPNAMSFKASKPDVRILILQIVIASILEFCFQSIYAVVALFFVIDSLLSYWYGIKVVVKRFFLYVVMWVMILGFTTINIPIISIIFPSFLMMMIKVYPIYLLLRLLVDKAPMNELLYVLDRSHISKSFSIPLMIVYRYVPTIIQEIHEINEGLKMRGLNLSFSNLKCLIRTVENYVGPLLFRSEKISEELSAASLCKGLSIGTTRTCCTNVRFTKEDYLYLLGMMVVTVALFFLDYLT